MEQPKMANILSVPNETSSNFTRTTKDGRTLTYEMNVLQQPQRARACGSGAKSSADRRPVDPPPVVELKVFEGESRKDITFQHNANFFLYTTLEPARQIAQPRGTSTPSPHPVLTGTPVAGMAYLDRPTQAGYFIFPDLSVRHEGLFRLSFNLYEDLKDAKDMDPNFNPEESGPANHHNIFKGSPVAPNSHVHFRLEVKSEPFTVYSAKKFPGLAESTNLSRVVAEQGCRVRIRRDVRMRRRETKPNTKEFDYEEEPATPSYQPEGRFATPDSYHHGRSGTERARSVSTVVSVDGSQPCVPPLERRQSSHDLGGYYGPQYPDTAPSPSAQSASTTYHHQPVPYAPSATPPYGASSHPSPSYAPSPTQAYHPLHRQPSHHRSSSNGALNYAYNSYQQGQSSSYSESSEYHRSDSQPAHQSRDSYPYPAVDNRVPGPPSASASYPTTPQSLDPRSTTPNNNNYSNGAQLPPLKTLQTLHHESLHYERKQFAQPPPLSLHATPLSASPSSPPSDIAPLANDQAQRHDSRVARLGKRSYGKVFDQSHLKQSNQYGTRPETVGLDVVQVECDGNLVDEDDLPSLRMLSYRRADGTRQQKQLPRTEGA